MKAIKELLALQWTVPLVIVSFIGIIAIFVVLFKAILGRKKDWYEFKPPLTKEEADYVSKTMASDKDMLTDDSQRDEASTQALFSRSNIDANHERINEEVASEKVIQPKLTEEEQKLVDGYYTSMENL